MKRLLQHMRLSTKSRYGVRAIFDIAYHSEGLGTQVNDISRRQEISSIFLVEGTLLWDNYRISKSQPWSLG